MKHHFFCSSVTAASLVYKVLLNSIYVCVCVCSFMVHSPWPSLIFLALVTCLRVLCTFVVT